jgi:hypothetical protein
VEINGDIGDIDMPLPLKSSLNIRIRFFLSEIGYIRSNY